MSDEHTVKSFDGEINRLNDVIIEMASLTKEQVRDAVTVVVKRDSELAGEIIEKDPAINNLELESHELTMRLLALRQPVAIDLRNIVVSIKISSDLERIGDYAANVAKRALVLNQLPPVKQARTIKNMGRVTYDLLKDVIDAYEHQDVKKALDVWHRDEEVDDMYTSIFRELLTYMMEDTHNITACTHLLFIARNLERIGDHATNIAEDIHFMIKGKPPTGRRPMGDVDGEFDIFDH
ncbi:MAG: phosphate signaling complex protein PhoU [Nitrospinae bacterium]|nr:phosphate signaling complex protein PhoU [Nitrospinota bacterium]